MQFLEVEGQRRCGYFHQFGDPASRKSLRTGLDQQPEHGQADRMSERGKRFKGVIGFHDSNIVESWKSKGEFFMTNGV
ncbi:hypothetical protein CBM2634_B170094 [Cupriavidus taiwanensis]|uniref:Uncharacterized protein n=1 Tax=Cupriavidus taiwanensis TaxID=164546 RepID=A0A375J6M8_9BURK|nr:hypothetical protein CBM2634_B170094 [Cupriavidus taiwanensis]